MGTLNGPAVKDVIIDVVRYFCNRDKSVLKYPTHMLMPRNAPFVDKPPNSAFIMVGNC